MSVSQLAKTKKPYVIIKSNSIGNYVENRKQYNNLKFAGCSNDAYCAIFKTVAIALYYLPLTFWSSKFCCHLLLQSVQTLSAPSALIFTQPRWIILNSKDSTLINATVTTDNHRVIYLIYISSVDEKPPHFDNGAFNHIPSISTDSIGTAFYCRFLGILGSDNMLISSNPKTQYHGKSPNRNSLQTATVASVEPWCQVAPDLYEGAHLSKEIVFTAITNSIEPSNHMTWITNCISLAMDKWALNQPVKQLNIGYQAPPAVWYWTFEAKKFYYLAYSDPVRLEIASNYK